MRLLCSFFLSVFGPSHDELIPILVRLASIANAYNRVLVDFPFWKNSLCLHDGTIRRTLNDAMGCLPHPRTARIQRFAAALSLEWVASDS